MHFTKKIPNWIFYVLGLFVVSRLVLGLLGIYIQTSPGWFGINFNTPEVFKYAGNLWLDIWSKWDTEKYIRIAREGYSSKILEDGFVNYVFFPLYPILIKTVSFLIKGNFFWAGWLISNLSLIASSFILYKLTRLDFDKDHSLKVVKYLYLLPVSFLFSAILTESLFLLLMLLSVYMARKRRWLYAGVFGFFLSLTRPFGILIIVALIIEYFEALKYKFRQIRPNVLFLLLPIAGIISFSIFNHYLVGDYFGFIHAEVLWGNILSNPIQTLILNILDGWRAPAIYSLIILFLIFYSLNKIRFSYWITSFLLFVIPLSFGLSSIFRYTVVIFPLCFILAGIGSSRAFDRCLTIILIILEVYLFIAWQIGSPLVI